MSLKYGKKRGLSRKIRRKIRLIPRGFRGMIGIHITEKRMGSRTNLSENEKRDVLRYVEAGKPLPEKYRFLLFEGDREVELVWNGKTDETETAVLPFQTIEHIDEPRSEEKIERQRTLFDPSGRQMAGWTNKLIWGDNKLILSSLKNGPLRKQIEAEGGLKLIYIDPPFDVGADFSMNIEIGDPSTGSGQVETFTKKPSVIEEIAYRDTWGKGADSFIAMIYERLKLMHGLLAEDGSIYVHCDWRVSGYMRLVLDEVFGKDNFKNEIVWHYKLGMKAKSRKFHSQHDILFWYTKNYKDFSFNEVRIPLEESIKRPKLKFDSKTKKAYQQKDEEGNPLYIEYNDELVGSVWDILNIPPKSQERFGYPTQKPEDLIGRIIKTHTKKTDLVADFFCGSGTTLSVAEKLGRKWIGSDLGKFAIHTTRKRMIGVQRELKKAGTDFRAFEILNIGKYEREKFLAVNENLREEEKRIQRENKDREFVRLVLSAYRAESVDSFSVFAGKKRDRLVAVGQLDTPVTNAFVASVVAECRQNNATKADVLGFDWEMGLDFEQGKVYGIDVRFKVIPREVFDRRVIEKGQVKFYDVAYIEAKPVVRGRGNVKEVAIELLDFSVFYDQDNTGEVEEKLKPGGSRTIIRNGQVLKLSKDKGSDIVSEEVLTKQWTDWIDYWSVDFDFESKKEIVRVRAEKPAQQKLDGSADPVQIRIDDYEERWTGNYVFENEWQSFRTKKDRSLELVSAFKEIPKGRVKIAVKVIDIFGNDTTKVIEINV